MGTAILISIIFVSITGVLLHFTHSWLNKGFLIHFISAVNESTWEHMKLAFIPFSASLVFQYLCRKSNYNNFWGTGFISTLICIFLIPVMYYPIKTLLKKEITLISISIFYISVISGFAVEHLLLRTHTQLIPESLGIFGLLILTLLFAIFTFKAPKIFLFRDPVHNEYGHKDISKM